MREDSLRAQGGDDREFEVEDANLRKAITRFLEDIPTSDAADIALETSHNLHEALQYLIDQNLLTRKQYNLLALAVALKGEAQPKEGILSTIVARMTLERRQILDALGWNKYPDENDPSVDVIV